MKKIIMLFVLLLGFVNLSYAGLIDEAKKLPVLKQGIMYDLNNSKITYLSTAEILNYKGVALEAGFSAEQSAVATLSYSLLKLKNLGVNVPIIDLVEFSVGYSYGVSRIDFTDGFGKGNNEEVHGPSVTLINIKF
jgi:hypothetical protein